MSFSRDRCSDVRSFHQTGFLKWRGRDKAVVSVLDRRRFSGGNRWDWVGDSGTLTAGGVIGQR